MGIKTEKTIKSIKILRLLIFK
jgi:hypothetical protein